MRETKAQIMSDVFDPDTITESWVVGNNTVEYHRANGERAIRLHHTDVLVFKPDGCIRFDSGGWRTPTTKARINEYQRQVRVWTDKRVWYAATVDAEKYIFKDGMYYDPDKGEITHAGNPEEVKALNKSIDDYAKRCVNSMPLDLPGPGDCWYCSMQTEDHTPLGDKTEDTSHLLNHIEDGYVVPSLVWNVLVERGCEPRGPRGNVHFHAVFKSEHGYIKLEDWKKDYKRWIVDYMHKRLDKTV